MAATSVLLSGLKLASGITDYRSAGSNIRDDNRTSTYGCTRANLYIAKYARVGAYVHIIADSRWI